ncbi:hypothetical protein ACFPRL_26900 [Pseudoclavibacter helvolus]
MEVEEAVQRRPLVLAERRFGAVLLVEDRRHVFESRDTREAKAGRIGLRTHLCGTAPKNWCPWRDSNCQRWLITWAQVGACECRNGGPIRGHGSSRIILGIWLHPREHIAKHNAEHNHIARRSMLKNGTTPAATPRSPRGSPSRLCSGHRTTRLTAGDILRSER